MCLLAAFVPHRPNKYFHVTASNGIVSNSPYTPLAIMTASPIASVRSAMQMSSRYVRCAPNAVDDRADHHADRSSTSAPHHQVRRCHRSIHCWHGHAARRSALPRERFSPLALFGLGAISELGPQCDLDLARLRLRPTRRVDFVAPIAGSLTSSGKTSLKDR